MAATKDATNEGGHGPHRGPDRHSALMPALHRALMATPLHQLSTSGVRAPWALQGIRLEGEVLEVGAGAGAMAARLLETTPGLRVVVTDYDPAIAAAPPLCEGHCAAGRRMAIQWSRPSSPPLPSRQGRHIRRNDSLEGVIDG
jgi:hypothetical protein